MAAPYVETTTAPGASATITGTARDATSLTLGFGGDINRFGAVVNTDQAGTLYIDGSSDGTTWRQQGSIAAVVNGSADLSVPLRFRFYRVRYVNGGTAAGNGNFSINSSFLSA